MTKFLLTSRQRSLLTRLIVRWSIISNLVVIAAPACCQQPSATIQGKPFRVAVYEGMKFHGDEQNFNRFYAGSTFKDVPLPKIFVQVNDRDVFDLRNIKENVIERMAPLKSKEEGLDVTIYQDTFWALSFREGKLVFVYFGYSSKPFKIGPTKEGPFESIPITRKRMIELFGEPKKWSTSPVMAP